MSIFSPDCPSPGKENMARGDIVTYAGKARGRRHGRAAAREMGRCLRTPSAVLCCFAFLGWRLVSYSLPIPFAGSCQRPGEGTRDM